MMGSKVSLPIGLFELLIGLELVLDREDHVLAHVHVPLGSGHPDTLFKIWIDIGPQMLLVVHNLIRDRHTFNNLLKEFMKCCHYATIKLFNEGLKGSDGR